MNPEMGEIIRKGLQAYRSEYWQVYYTEKEQEYDTNSCSEVLNMFSYFV